MDTPEQPPSVATSDLVRAWLDDPNREFWQPLYDGTNGYERCKIIGIKVITQVEPGFSTYGLDNNIETFETDLEDLRLDCPNS